jgi:hypothetical protein
MGRRYRRRSHSSQIIADSVVIGSRLSWVYALLFGLISFLIFYYAFPYWLESRLNAAQGVVSYPGLEVMYGRGIRLFHYLGIATGAVGLFFAVRNYFVLSSTNRSENRVIALLARLIGRHFD